MAGNFAVAVQGAPAILEQTNNLANTLTQYKINQRDFEHAKTVLDAKADEVAEGLSSDVIVGVSEEKLDELCEILISEHASNDPNAKKKFKSFIKSLKICDRRICSVEKLDVKISEYASMCGFIAGVKKEGLYSVLYAFHTLKFKVRPVPTWWGLGQARPGVLSQKDIDAVKENYSKYKALKTFESGNIIHRISFN